MSGWHGPFARALNVWDAADHIGSLVADNPRPIERPAQLHQRVMLPSPKRWPDCPICNLDVVRCDCAPDRYAAAVSAALREDG